MQMISHQFLSLLVIIYISIDNHMFKDKATRVVEIATEALLFVSCLFIQVLILPLEEASINDVSVMIYISVGLLIFVNIAFVIYNVRLNCKDKKRLKLREKRRETWENAWKKVEKSKPSRFQKPREYAKELEEENGVQLERKAIALKSLMQAPLPAIQEESSRSRNEMSEKASERDERSNDNLDTH